MSNVWLVLPGQRWVCPEPPLALLLSLRGTSTRKMSVFVGLCYYSSSQGSSYFLGAHFSEYLAHLQPVSSLCMHTSFRFSLRWGRLPCWSLMKAYLYSLLCPNTFQGKYLGQLLHCIFRNFRDHVQPTGDILQLSRPSKHPQITTAYVNPKLAVLLPEKAYNQHGLLRSRPCRHPVRLWRAAPVLLFTRSF